MVTGVTKVDLEISRTGNNVFEITDGGNFSFTGVVKFIAKFHERDTNAEAVINLTSPVGITVTPSLITLTITPADVLTTLPYEMVVVKYELTVNGALGVAGNLTIRPQVIR
jgi:hypothetical protein